MVFDRTHFSDELLISLYRQLITPRIIEEKMLILLRQGKISKWFSGIGQEAISVGATAALTAEEYILPMHRNLGIFTSRDVPLWKLFAQFQGKKTGFTKGRDRSFHFGTQEHKIVGMISHLGQQLGIADGISLSHKLDHNAKATLVFTGDGGASEGDFHEAINTAAVWDLPVIIVVENNQWGLSTPSSEQFRCKQFIDKGIGYGIEAIQCDGNNILDVFSKINYAAEAVRQSPRPILVEAMTFRRRGHEEASGTKYYPDGLIEKWEQFDPISNYEKFLMEAGILNVGNEIKIKEEIKAHVASEWEKSMHEPEPEFNEAEELADVFAPFEFSITDTVGSNKTEMRLVDAVSNGLKQAMEKHDNLVLMGQDIAEYGGVFKITDGFVDQFGKERVRNTPLCESAILGAGLGLSMAGKKAMVEMQFADFVTEGFTQINNNLAKIHYRWGQNADVVVRMPTGAGVNAGPFHSQSNEAWFFNTPGLKIAYPSTPEDAKGLLLTAFEDPNPVLFFEHKALYRSIKTDVSDDYYTIPFGKARIAAEGTDLSIITYGMGVHWALDWKDKNPGTSVEIIDLRTLAPIDWNTIFESVKKTNRVCVLHEDTLTGGIGGELVAQINECCFEYLDAPIARIGSTDTPVPFAAKLEFGFLASSKIQESLERLLAY